MFKHNDTKDMHCTQPSPLCYHRVTAAGEGNSSKSNESKKQVTPNRSRVQPTHEHTLLRLNHLIVVPDNLQNIYQMMQLLFELTFLRGVEMENEELNWKIFPTLAGTKLICIGLKETFGELI